MTQGRRSISRETSVTGVGLHTGADVVVTFRPGEEGKGVVFRRSDLPTAPPIPARLAELSTSDRRVTLGRGDVTVSTVEHLLAAVAACRLDDLTIDVRGPEIPAADGSALPFLQALGAAGISEGTGQSVTITVRAPLVVREGDAEYIVAPAKSLRLTVTIEWDHPVIGRQSGCYDIADGRFAQDVAGARTFGFARDEQSLRAQGLIKGVSADNVIVLTEQGVMGGPLRWPDEFVRHKAVDLLGDLALLGGHLAADVVAFRPSHRGNLALARAIERTAAHGAPPIMGIQDILGIMPHRYPMLLVDRIIEIEPGKRIVGIKNVTINEPFFPGHFPDHPVMPGVLIIEAMAQTGGTLLMGGLEDPQSKIVYFMSIDSVKFRRPVVPGDQLRFELEVLRFRGKTCLMRGAGYVDGQVVAEAEMMAALIDR